MTYAEWLDTLVSPISYFISWLTTIADNLINNYFVITLLGICLFLSLVWCIFYFIFDVIDKVNNRYDDYNDKYYNYELLKEVQSDYLDNHYTDEFDYRYRSKVLNLQVSNGVLQQNSDLVSSVKNSNFKLDVDALKDMQYDNLTDDNPYNDNDVSIISNIPKKQLADVKELHKNLIEENPNLHQELVKEINSEIDDFLNEHKDLVEKLDYVFIDNAKVKRSVFESNSFNSDNYFNNSEGFLVNKKTGEIVGENFPLIPTGSITYANISEEEKKAIERHNDEQARRLGIKRYHDTSHIDEDLDSQLFS